MTAYRTSENPVSVNPYDVLAKADGDLMIHAMLCNEDIQRNDVTTATELRVSHMGPPLGPWSRSCDAVGSVPLDGNDHQKLKTYVDMRRQENKSHKLKMQLQGVKWDPASQYQIHPPSSPPSANYSLWRFSCVGYVLQAYRSVRIKLLDEDRPEITIGDLKRLYPDAADLLDDVVERGKLGIGEGDRWPVALVGYLLHSLARDVTLIRGSDAKPYVAQEGDEYFPRQENSPASKIAHQSTKK